VADTFHADFVLQADEENSSGSLFSSALRKLSLEFICWQHISSKSLSSITVRVKIVG